MCRGCGLDCLMHDETGCAGGPRAESASNKPGMTSAAPVHMFLGRVIGKGHLGRNTHANAAINIGSGDVYEKEMTVRDDVH